MDSQVEALPPKFYDDLLEYPTMFVIDFPPYRDAQHNIDIIVDYIILNKVAYCVNFKVHKNMHEQEQGFPKKSG